MTTATETKLSETQAIALRIAVEYQRRSETKRAGIREASISKPTAKALGEKGLIVVGRESSAAMARRLDETLGYNCRGYLLTAKGEQIGGELVDEQEREDARNLIVAQLANYLRREGAEVGEQILADARERVETYR